MKTKILAFFIFFSLTAHSQALDVGIRIQKTDQMYWENGVSAQYSFTKVKPQFFIGFDYVTSRLGSAYNSNAIKQDSYLLSASWLFNKNKQYHIVTRLNMGYFYSDLEDEMFQDVPHTAFLLSPELGLKYNLKKLPLSFNLGAGYYIITAKDGYSPGTLQPFYYHFDIYYNLIKPK